MRRILKAELEHLGSVKSPNKFRELLADIFAEMFPSWTDEDLLFNPRQGLEFCDVIRRRTRLPKMDDDLILRTLVNCRKNADAYREA
jgi:hypothetical protein